MDAVAMDRARFRDHDQQRVERLQAVRQPGKPTIGAPCRDRRNADLAVHPCIVIPHNERADRRVQLGKRELRP